MKRGPWFRRFTALLSFVPALWVAPRVFAQDLQFNDEDTVIDSQQVLENNGDQNQTNAMGPPVTTALVIPSDNLDADTASEISDLLVDELHTLPDVQVVDYQALKDEFDVMGSELALECAFDPVCLGRVGSDAGLDEIIVGRATGRNGSELQLVLDRVSVSSRSVVRYRPVRTDSDRASLTEMVHSQLPFLYDLRQENQQQVTHRTGPSELQVAMAWTSLGLGVVALGLGIYFGISANNGESDVRDARLVEQNVRDLTQVQADRQLADAQDQALLANVMFGTGLALVGVSLLLFLITPGEDIDANADQVGLGPSRPRVGAMITQDGWGVFGQVRF
jgi:hypothetical protein